MGGIDSRVNVLTVKGQVGNCDECALWKTTKAVVDEGIWVTDSAKIVGCKK
jgi:hypothetical protein